MAASAFRLRAIPDPDAITVKRCTRVGKRTFLIYGLPGLSSLGIGGLLDGGFESQLGVDAALKPVGERCPRPRIHAW